MAHRFHTIPGSPFAREPSTLSAVNLRHDRLRRTLGLVFLGLAVLLLACGLTVLQSRLEGVAFLFYWMGCYLATSLALLVAFYDAWLVRQRARREEHELANRTLGDIPEARREGRRGSGHDQGIRQ